jgi:phosphoribosylaminoimidazolecarboxamide formyltransferase/IMP cyclohydrolase
MPSHPVSSNHVSQNPSAGYALISVSDKTGVVGLAQVLHDQGMGIISTGGTAQHLSEAGIPVIPIEQITGNPESFDGRMKTISFAIEGGILYDRQNQTHQQEAAQLQIPDIRVVVCNLYPFSQTIADQDTTFDQAREQIDVGGPTMLRAAAKNAKQVLPLIDPEDYSIIAEVAALAASASAAVPSSAKDETEPQDGISATEHPGGFLNRLSSDQRLRLAAKTFRFLSWYDSQISQYLEAQAGSASVTEHQQNDASNESETRSKTSEEVLFHHYTTLSGVSQLPLRYGENPHQKAVWYANPQSNAPMNRLQKQSGRDLSLLNLTDINAGLESVRLFSRPAAVVIKHTSPSGVALGDSISQALERAIAADPVSAFGGVIVANQPLDTEAATVIAGFKEAQRGNIDILAAPAVNDDAFAQLSGVRKTMGIYTFGTIPATRQPSWNLKWVDGGFLLQESDDQFPPIDSVQQEWKVVTKAQPTDHQWQQMAVAWRFLSRIKSNAILVMDPELPMTRGIGAGQTSRVGAVKLALELAGEHRTGAVLASDSFFPFADSVTAASAAGIGAIIQQGGSVRDADSIEAADADGIPMVFTGRRAFWH